METRRNPNQFQHSMISDDDFTFFWVRNYMFAAAAAPSTGKSSWSGSGLIIVLTVTKGEKKAVCVSDLLTGSSPNLYQKHHNEILSLHLEVCLLVWDFCSCGRNAAPLVRSTPSSPLGGVWEELSLVPLLSPPAVSASPWMLS